MAAVAGTCRSESWLGPDLLKTGDVIEVCGILPESGTHEADLTGWRRLVAVRARAVPGDA
jgi:hypothetical protein